MRALLAALFVLSAGPAAGQEVERESFSVLGWNNACSVAVQQFGYATLGAAIKDDPVLTRIGTITIAPGEDAAKTVWAVDWGGARTWQKGEAKQALQDLAAAGYTREGYPEDIRVPREGAPHPFEAAIVSTATFGMRSKFKWPGKDWRWDRVVFSPLGACGLFVYSRREDGRPFYSWSLQRFYNPAARIERAQAHLTNSRLLIEASDLEAALAEAATAAHLQPELAATRYRHAAMLCLSGQLNESVTELGAAVRLDARMAAEAHDDPDFYEVNEFPGFRALVGHDPNDYRESDGRRR